MWDLVDGDVLVLLIKYIVRRLVLVHLYLPDVPIAPNFCLYQALCSVDGRTVLDDGEDVVVKKAASAGPGIVNATNGLENVTSIYVGVVMPPKSSIQ